MVFNLALNYSQRREDAEEITQDVFLKVHDKRSEFSNKASLKTWIYRIAVNVSLDHIRSKKRQKRWGIHVPLFTGRSSVDKTPGYEIPDMDHPGVRLEDKEDLEKLFEQIGELPMKQRTALLLKATEGLSQAEIAEVMKISVKAAESLLSRARANLKEKRRN